MPMLKLENGQDKGVTPAGGHAMYNKFIPHPMPKQISSSSEGREGTLSRKKALKNYAVFGSIPKCVCNAVFGSIRACPTASAYQMTMIARPLQYDTEPHKDNPRSRENLAVNVDILPFEEKKEDDGMSSNGSADASAQVQRKLKQRHISMIAVAGTIGTGLFLGSGQSLRQAGPIGTLLGYILMGAVVFSMQVALVN
ncbi:uncharacterized protein PGTG_07284 [Puccinia graminis f. sp. tritici CRL 75-36-700-3]|uniref:Amino acid permease/ SLC12A domain-containing protein n=1 Tax=Puccinia graminis f. sp. tritici (strain CRL 75-36-700-3 / race SCCL) TaxID=418459 RepID=E3KA50_PUCGT|nr:uncharacterized protein PGTG_07284 [Puccinia graminis f. sp. tritici CRL 75-36-700-3]EFP81032.2 hypothetical protein PGTG_07284 [Puccinia graminis f. sp. tritici CRL 75-36-700-3]